MLIERPNLPIFLSIFSYQCSINAINTALSTTPNTPNPISNVINPTPNSVCKSIGLERFDALFGLKKKPSYGCPQPGFFYCRRAITRLAEIRLFYENLGHLSVYVDDIQAGSHFERRHLYARHIVYRYVFVIAIDDDFSLAAVYFALVA